MKWLYRWLGNKIKDSQSEKLMRDMTEVALNSPNSRVNSHGMNFSIYRADGGYIIEQRTFHKKTGQYDNHLHIVTDDKDLGEELAKIITFSNLRS